jgi:hypothetical protein
MVDLVIRGGLVYDGSGDVPVVADVAITDGVVSAVGEITDTNVEEIDATGLIVTTDLLTSIPILMDRPRGKVKWHRPVGTASPQRLWVIAALALPPCANKIMMLWLN